MKKIFLLGIIIFGLLFLSAHFCFATNNLLNIPAPPPVSQNTTLPAYLTWVFNLGIAIGFLSIIGVLVAAGVFYILGGGFPSMRSKARDYLSGAVTGFIIFMLLFLLLKTIYPDFVAFKFGKPLVQKTLNQTVQQIHGVYFYVWSDSCDSNGTPPKDTPDFYTSTSNTSDLNQLTNNAITKSIAVVQDPALGSYVSVIYDSENYYGQCQYIDTSSAASQKKCIKTSDFIPRSATIDIYNYPGSGSVTFYRSPNFNKANGYLVLSSNDIGKIYTNDLAGLQFTGYNVGSNNSNDCTVPKDQQDCDKWDANGKCQQQKCPSLTETNIGSIETDGNYLVLLIYKSLNDDSSNYAYSYCQAYPTDSDINKNGPKQVKWDAIYTQKNPDTGLPLRPNYVFIVPIKNPNQ